MDGGRNMKLQISLDDELVARIDSCADSNYMSRSGFISQACVQMLNQTEAVSSLVRISYACQKVAETNQLDDETKQQFKDFERIAKVLLGK